MHYLRFFMRLFLLGLLVIGVIGILLGIACGLILFLEASHFPWYVNTLIGALAILAVVCGLITFVEYEVDHEK